MEVPPDLSRTNFFFLFLNTLLIGVLLSVFAILQPAFLRDIIKIDQDFAGSINSFQVIMGQAATLLLVAWVGALSDRVGRKPLAAGGFAVLAVCFYLYWMSNGIAAGLHIPAQLSSRVCALLSFAPSRAAGFIEFAPGLLVAYGVRLLIGVAMVLIYPQFIAMVADYTCEKDRGKGMAANGLMMALASLVVFVVLAPVQKSAGVEVTFYIAAAVAAAGAIGSRVFLKDRLRAAGGGKGGLRQILPLVKTSPALKVSYAFSLVTRADVVVLATFLVTWAVKVADARGLSSVQATARASVALAILGGVSFAAFPIVGVLLDRWGRLPTLILCVLLDAAAMLIVMVSPDPFSPVVWAAMVPAAFGMAGAVSGAATLASESCPRESLGAVLGGLNTMQPVGILFFLFVGGYLFDRFGPAWAFGLKGFSTLVLAAWVIAVRNQIKKPAESG